MGSLVDSVIENGCICICVMLYSLINKSYKQARILATPQETLNYYSQLPDKDLDKVDAIIITDKIDTKNTSSDLESIDANDWFKAINGEQPTIV